MKIPLLWPILFLIVSAWPLIVFAKESKLNCSGYGLQRLNKEKILLDQSAVSEAELRNGETLNLNFLSAFGFDVEFDEDQFVAAFSREDEGSILDTKTNFKKLSSFKNFKKVFDVNLLDGEAKRDYWRVEVSCSVEGL